jgi:hypothetical protein
MRIAVGSDDGGIDMYQLQVRCGPISVRMVVRRHPDSLASHTRVHVPRLPSRRVFLCVPQCFTAHTHRWPASASPDARRQPHSHARPHTPHCAVLRRAAQLRPVHALHGERFAQREGLTDVVATHLLSEQKARIRCREHITGVAMYRDRLAVQLPDRVNLYEVRGYRRGVFYHCRCAAIWKVCAR